MSSVKLLMFQMQWEGVITTLHAGRGELCEFKTSLKQKWRYSSEDGEVSPGQSFLQCLWCSGCGGSPVLFIFVVGSNFVSSFLGKAKVVLLKQMHTA